MYRVVFLACGARWEESSIRHWWWGFVVISKEASQFLRFEISYYQVIEQGLILGVVAHARKRQDCRLGL